MNVLVVGGGAREHALAWKIAQSPQVKRVVVAPGNAGWGDTAQVVPEDVAGQVALAKRERMDLVVVGPESALAAGIVDAMQAAGVSAFGPTRAAARIETSKAFAKRLMAHVGVATPAFRVVQTADGAAREIRAHFARSAEPLVVKADRLMAGKGVAVCATEAEALAFAAQVGGVLVLEECVSGQEVSLHVVTDGERMAVLPLAADHKRLGDGDSGPNTGGMGAVCPVASRWGSPSVPSGFPFRSRTQPTGLRADRSRNLREFDAARLADICVRPVLAALARDGCPFRGVLFAGLMVDGARVNVLEYNARFGDPETEVLMPLWKGDIVPTLLEPARQQVQAEPGAAAAVVLAARGYPATPEKGSVVTGLADAGDVNVFHAGTRRDGDKVVTSGGRVIVVSARGVDLRSAVDNAYAGASQIQFDGMQLRRDIGGRYL